MIAAIEHHSQYKVILLAPPEMKAEGERAHALLGMALGTLNTHKIPPGFRFSDDVTAKPEIQHDVDVVAARVRKEKDIALVVTLGFEPDSLKPLTAVCKTHGAQICFARHFPPISEMEDFPEMSPLAAILKQGVHAHGIDQGILTDPLPGAPDQLQCRLESVIQMLALGVMMAHDAKREGGIGFS